MQWQAIYNNNEMFPQFNTNGTENKYSDIQRDRLVSFNMYDGDKLILSVELERPTQKLICRKRTFMNNKGGRNEIWLAGWHENVNGRSIKSICYIYPDGHIHFAGAKDDLELMKGEI